MQYNIHLPYYNETFLYGYGFGIRSFFSRWPPFSGRLKSSDHRILKKMNMPLNNNFLVNTSSSFLITEIPPEKKMKGLTSPYSSFLFKEVVN